MLCLAVLGTACGGRDYNYVGSASLNTFFRVPSTWTGYSQQDLLHLITAGADPGVSERFKFLAGFDASPDPSIQRVVHSASMSDHPVVVSWVEQLPEAVRDQVSLRSLRNTVFPVDQIANEGAGDILNYDTFTLPGGVHGSRTQFVVTGRNPTADAPPLEFSQIVAVDANTNLMYLLSVHCSPLCFQRYRTAIQNVLDSWTVKEH